MPDTTQPSTAPPNPQPDLTGRTLGDFHILRRIGTGGMGQVYLARQTSLKRDVALKLLRGELNTNLTALKRFQAEAQAVAKLNHPNIVHIHQIGEADGLQYMVLEFVDGRNLRDYLARKGPPDLPVTLSVMRQVALALQKAHEQGIVHRDIKPENILVTRKVEVKVTDFGLSRFFAGDQPATNLTQSGVTLGTPLYMSPEQVQGQAVDNRSDIYSFGVTCYHLLAGEPPFRGASAFEVALKHVQEQPRLLSDLRPDLPPDLCGMIHKMMAKHPADRYQSARDIVRDLIKVRDGLALPASPAAGPTPSGSALVLTQFGPPPTASGPLPAAPGVRWGRLVVAGFVCVLAATAGVFASLAFHPPEPPHPATTPSPNPPPAGPGLPDVRFPSADKDKDRPTTTRERELIAILNSEATNPETAVKASIELGLLYLKEHHFADAEKRFEVLKNKPLPEPHKRTAYITGRLGSAVVLAHKNEAEASNKLFLEVVNEPPPKPIGPKADRFGVTVSWTLLRFPELSAAVSDALNRNAANLGKPRLDGPLEALRSPPRVGKRD
jgi:serine/threonine-protein kinase